MTVFLFLLNGVINPVAFPSITTSLVATDSITEGNTTVETVDTGTDGHIKFTTEGTERMRFIYDG